MGLSGKNFSVAELAEAGVKRISVGSSFARLAFGSLFEAVREIQEDGTFTFADRAASFADIERLLK